MEAYAKWGVDLAIDLEHQMLDPDIAPDPTAKDARGWCNLELRGDGSLWAVNVKWTADGAARLSEKRQRYISPAFSIDPETSRVIAIINVAITAIPATHDTPALVAASRAKPHDLRRLSTGVAFGDVQTALGAALSEMYPSPSGDSCSPDGPWVMDVFDATVVYQMKGAYYEAPYTFDGAKATIGTAVEVRRSYVPVDATAGTPAPAGAAPTSLPAPPAAPAANRKKTPHARRLNLGKSSMTIEQFLKVIKALGLDQTMSLDDAMAQIRGESPTKADADAPASTATPPAADPPAADAKDDAKEVVAAASRLMRLTGASSFVSAINVVETFRTSHIELETERKKLASERETLEGAERRAGCVELVTLGGHAPSTVWSDDKATAPKKYLAAMSMADFRDYVADAVKSKGGTVKLHVLPPGNGGAAHGLTAEELAVCTAMKCEPAAFAALKAQRDGVKTGGN